MCLTADFLFPLKDIGESLLYHTNPLRSVIGNYSFHIKDGSPKKLPRDGFRSIIVNQCQCQPEDINHHQCSLVAVCYKKALKSWCISFFSNNNNIFEYLFMV